MARKNSLDPIRKEYEDFIKLANERYQFMKENNIQVPALWEAQRTQKPQYSEGFSLDDKKSFRELRREVRRAESFMRDPTVKDFGAKDFMIKEGAKKYSKAFGNQWAEKYGVSYDRSRISDDKAREAFKLYHQLAAEMQETIKTQYGSENLINALYDQVVQNWGTPFDREQKLEELRLNMYTYLQDVALQKENKARFERDFDEEYGVINLRRLKDAKSRADYYVKLAEAFEKGNYF